MITFPSTLILGGARSGKSRFAETLAHESGLARVYIATAEAFDDEMAARIAHHRTTRAAGWTLIEEPLALAATLGSAAEPSRIVLVECLTLWLGNLYHAGRDADAEIAALIAAIGAARGPLILVSNEVGLGLVPETALGRAFRDAQGRLNQSVAAAVSQVVFVAAGLPLILKAPPAQSGRESPGHQ